MLSTRTRSGVVETVHDGAIAVVGADGGLIASSGNIDRPFYLRSSAKPFQAHVAQREGAALRPIELAVASASHDGDPVHVAIGEEMRDAVGLGLEDPGCSPDWPLSVTAVRTLARRGHERRRRVWHNCSGKHAAVAALEALGTVTQAASERLTPVGRPVAWGGGQVVGEMGPRVELRWS